MILLELVAFATTRANGGLMLKRETESHQRRVIRGESSEESHQRRVKGVQEEEGVIRGGSRGLQVKGGGRGSDYDTV